MTVTSHDASIAERLRDAAGRIPVDTSALGSIEAGVTRVTLGPRPRPRSRSRPRRKAQMPASRPRSSPVWQRSSSWSDCDPPPTP
jgi:hypothetical protein